MKTTRPGLPSYEVGFIVAASAIVILFVAHILIRFLAS